MLPAARLPKRFHCRLQAENFLAGNSVPVHPKRFEVTGYIWERKSNLKTESSGNFGLSERFGLGRGIWRAI